MNLPDSWSDPAALVHHLGLQLVKGRLGLFLGAGLSQFYGLPDWDELVNRLCTKVGEPQLTPKDDPIVKVAALRAKHYQNKTTEFLGTVHEALYRGKTLDFEEIRKNDTLAAIGSLVMSSKRGSAAKVITLNYDDLLEIYLEYHGFVTTSVWQENHWANDDDVTIYHPHGFLPLSDRDPSSDIVLGSLEYFEIMNSDSWRPLLETHLRTHTFLYIGLSGSDMHLQNLISNTQKHHAIKNDRLPYHSVRFAVEGNPDDVGAMLDGLGVFTHRLSSYADLPGFLFSVCQAARQVRAR